MMLMAKKLLRLLLCVNILVTHNYIYPEECDPQSILDIAHISTKLKACIELTYDMAQDEDCTAALDTVYDAIANNKKIISRASAQAAARDALDFLEYHAESFVSPDQFLIISTYLTNYLTNLTKSTTIIDTIKKQKVTDLSHHTPSLS